MTTRHDMLKQANISKPEDWHPYGDEDRAAERHGGWGPDCSWGCDWFQPLHNPESGGADADWGVCTNPKSHRCGLLTFEHQGCPEFEGDDDE